MARRVRSCGREWEVLRDFERSDNWYAKRPTPTTKQRASRKKERSRRRAPGIAPTIKLIISTLASASASLLPQAKTSHCAAMLHDGCNPSLHVGLRNANQRPFAVRALAPHHQSTLLRNRPIHPAGTHFANSMLLTADVSCGKVAIKSRR